MKKIVRRFFYLNSIVLAGAIVIFSCKQQPRFKKEVEVPMEEVEKQIKKEIFGAVPDGRDVELYTMVNKNGLRARVMTFGAILVSLEVPDRDGKLSDITLGYDTFPDYLSGTSYFGAIVGRYGNRIGKGTFTLNGVTYQLATNNGENHLHGGIKGFNKVLWEAESFERSEAAGVKLSYLSIDGEEGYPGNLTSAVTYTLTNKNELVIDYQASTDNATPINMTHHSYFCLAGQGERDILGHELMLNAENYTPVDEGLIPTGEIRSVKNSFMDFTSPKTIGRDIDQVQGGYDHNYVLTSGGGTLALAARVHEPSSGRIMEVYTTEPGIQFYSGNFLDGSVTGKSGKVYQKHYGFCLETQHFPDSPNNPQFPSAILYPGDNYTHKTVLKFLTE